jgi:hypothetical protein
MQENLESYTMKSFLSIADGTDYIGNPEMLTLSNMIQSSCFTFNVINDNIYELQEDLFANLTTTDQTVTLRPSFRIVRIDDDDSELHPKEVKPNCSQALLGSQRIKTAIH